MSAAAAVSHVRSVFVPEYALQGQEFSGHVLWDPSAELVSVSLGLPAGVSLKHIYNVPGDSLVEQPDRTIAFSRVESGGYAGFVLISERFPEPDVTLEVGVSITLKVAGVPSKSFQSFRVNLFRPLLWLETVSRVLTTELPPGDYCLRVSKPIHILNEGKGTALVLVFPKGLSQDRVTDYLLQDDVRKTHQRVVDEGLTKLQGEHPGFEAYIELWKGLVVGRLVKIDDETVSRLERLQEASKSVEQDNPDLIERIGEVFFDAMLAVFTIDQRFKAWTQAMNATLENGVVILNPSTAVRLDKGRTSLDFDVGYLDLLFHPFPAFTLKGVQIESASEGILPVFELFTTAPVPIEELPERRKALRGGRHDGRREGR